MAKRKGNIDARQDELDLEPCEGQDGTVPPPGDPPFGAGTARLETSRTSGAGQGEPGGVGASATPVTPLPAFATEGFWHAEGMASFATSPVRAFRLRRFLVLGAIVALAAGCGALAGTLATAGLNATAHQNASEASMKVALDRVGEELTALRAKVESSAQDMHARTVRIAERLEKSERAQAEPAQKLVKISEALDRLERRTAQALASAAAASDVTGSVGDSRGGGDGKKMAAVNGWSLYQVRNGAALIEGRDGIVEVEPGDILPGLGRVEAIRKQDGRWVVVTSRGVIVDQH